jgi:hypothetical protein
MWETYELQQRDREPPGEGEGEVPPGNVEFETRARAMSLDGVDASFALDPSAIEYVPFTPDLVVSDD